ncbi:MAG: type IV pilus secretin PilQ [Bdellovibrionota bacterium]
MKRIFQNIVMMAVLSTLISCVSQQSSEGDDFASPEAATAASDEPTTDSSSTENTESNNSSTENESNQVAQEEQPQNEQAQKSEDELLLDETTNEEQAKNEPPPEELAPPAEQQIETLQPPPATEVPTLSLVEIKNIQYKGNDTGGTLVVEATGPFTYTTRSNVELKQFIIEIPNSVLPQKLKRPLNTKDFKGGIGSIDAYQNAGSNVSRFVLQLREGAQDPVLQTEGNSLLVVTNDTALPANIQAEMSPDTLPVKPNSLEAVPPRSDEEETSRREGLASGSGATQEDRALMTNINLEDFMAGNKKFYGRKVSCSFDDVQVRDAIEFIMLDSGLNLILDDLKDIGAINLRIREVPWDQCLVLIMKVKKLGYTRMGNVLRISKLDDIAKDEDEAIKRAEARKKVEPVKVRIFPISYAQAKDLEAQIKNFLSKDRGAVTSDGRTNSLIVTSTDEDLEKIAKMLSSLDTPPPQVLIEGKIVEATESVNKSMGINWGFSGQDIKLGTNKSTGSPINMRPTFNYGGFASGAATTAGFGLNIGTLDILGDLGATLSLFETENRVKVLSSPRIITMNNEAASISQTTNQPQATITTTGTTTQKTYTAVPVVLSLNVTPQITNDASIIMKVSVTREFTGAAVDSADPTSMPKFSRKADTKVIVKNGQTTVIGGIYQNDTAEGSNGISGLQDIPILGYLFKGQTSKKDKNELLIFLTPRIVSNTTETGTPATSGL